MSETNFFDETESKIVDEIRLVSLSIKYLFSLFLSEYTLNNSVFNFSLGETTKLTSFENFSDVLDKFPAYIKLLNEDKI